ncbi:MAG: family 78 glycoside hydrolase catalytic domain [Cyclobacteriaceae bacterium]|nr:family 78 glycoside hydrolase catalytic domain [Cyclobacteriaceae bacterium]
MHHKFLFLALLNGFFLLSGCQTKDPGMNREIEFSSLLCEYEENPLGIDNPAPRLTWIPENTLQGGFQTAWQVLVSDSPEMLDRDEGNIWDSGRVFSSQSAQVEYEGKPLQTARKYYWKVRIWDQAGKPSSYSRTAGWETGLLEPQDWDPEWISAPRVFDWAERDRQRKQLDRNAPPGPGERAPLFRKSFLLKDSIDRARLYVSGLGYYESWINGRKAGDQVLDPAFTDYERTVLYETHDVTGLLTPGRNAIGIMLGNGWYDMASRGVWSFDRAPWRDDPVLGMILRVDYRDGTSEFIRSDSSWKCFPGPITFNSIRQGEFYDARLEQSGWTDAGYDDRNWHPVRPVDGPKGKLRSQVMPPIRITEKLDPVSITKLPGNIWVCDFGQNIAGFGEISMSLPEGTRIRLIYSEKLHENGTVDQRNIDGLVAQDPFQTDEYIANGRDSANWHPRFVYHGFQYIQIEGFPGELQAENIRACVVHTDFARKGRFECSDPLLNRIQLNSEWSFLNNYHGYPTDCPHREKNGWTGDAQLANDMALFNYRVEGAYDKWLDDIVDSQLESGMIPAIVPTGGWGYHWGNGPAWDFALFILPWNMYVYSGDRQVLERYYPSMQKYLDFLGGTTDDLIIRWGLGDWVPARTLTPPELITTAYYHEQAEIASKIAETLGYVEDRQQYLDLAHRIRTAFNDHFVSDDPPGVGNGSQTSLGCALYFDMLDPVMAGPVLQQLIDRIQHDEWNLDFGVLGSKFVPNALAESGHQKTAYEMINTEDFPGWGNWVKQGATTLWEDWQGESSRNHMFFGDVSAWFYKYLAGIRPDERQPGFSHFYIDPFFPDDLQWVNAEVDTWYGRIACNWKKMPRGISVSLAVPFNTSATVRLREARNLQIREIKTDAPMEVERTEPEKDVTEFTLRAGNYELIFER